MSPSDDFKNNESNYELNNKQNNNEEDSNENNNNDEEEYNDEEENDEEENNEEENNEEENNNNNDDDEDKNKYLIQEDIIGIDLGTTNTCCGIWRNGNLEIIPDEYGNRTIPSYVAYTNVNRYIGIDAKNQKDINTKNVFYEVKRLIGRQIDDPFVIKEKNLLSYNIEADDKKNIILVSDLHNKKRFTPEEISAAILSKIKMMASNYLGKKITKAVITIPANFNDGQRQATKDAAVIAGLECVRIINEPTAAALAYGLLNRSKIRKSCLNDELNGVETEIKHIIVYDFGGGTLDVTLMEIENGIFEVLCSAGNTRHGGSDFDNRLMSYSIGKFSKQNNIKEIDRISNISLQKLRTSCEQAKKILSTSNKTHIAVKNFYTPKYEKTALDLFVSITREELEKMCGDLFLLSLKPIEHILRECALSSSDIDEVILVGGMTRMPKIRELIKQKFCGKEPNCTINPEEAVAAGAAMQAYFLSHGNDAFSSSMTLLDKTSLSLGVETVGGIMDVLIERGSLIPAIEEKEYSTDQDYVDSVIIKIFEGERTMTKDNFFVGEFELKGIEPAPRGIPEILVKFSIDSNGIITVTAENKKTNETNSLAVTSNKGRLSKEKIDELIMDALDLEVRDELEKKKKMNHYEIEDFCSNIMTNLKNKEFKLSDRDKEIITDDISEILIWIKEKKYSERDHDEIENILESIKKKYGVLILKGNLENIDEEIKNNNSDGLDLCTTVYGKENEDEKNIIFEQLENESQGFIGLSDAEKADLKELRQAVSDLCYSIYDIINSGNLNISINHATDMKDFIDDALLWLHIHEKPTKMDYKIKLDEINDTCNKIFDHYHQSGKEIFDKNKITESIKNSRDELENLCFVIKLLIEDGAFPINKTTLENLQSNITNILDWIYQQDDASDTNNEKQQQFESECRIKIDELNKLCDTIYQKMKNINLDENNKTLKNATKVVLTGCHNNLDKVNGESEQMGTDILQLLRQKQQNIIEDMINDENNINNNDNDVHSNNDNNNNINNF
jgi:molecular chaperone DnaK (HSP70)